MKDSTISVKTKTLYGVSALVFWLLVWQGAYLLVNKRYLLVSPVDAFSRILALCREAAFWQSVLATCVRVVSGFALAFLLGALLAFFAHYAAPARILFAPLLGIIRATPVASFIILALIWISTNRLPVFIAFLMVLPLVYSNLTAGLSALDKQLLEMAQLFRMGRKRKIRLIILPGLMPYVTAACTAGLGFAWKSTIAAEVIAHPAFSIGKKIYDAKVYLEVADLFAWTIAVILLSVLIEKVAVRALKALERRLLRLRITVAGGDDHAS